MCDVHPYFLYGRVGPSFYFHVAKSGDGGIGSDQRGHSGLKQQQKLHGLNADKQKNNNDNNKNNKTKNQIRKCVRGGVGGEWEVAAWL